jgi:hypothetical protein
MYAYHSTRASLMTTNILMIAGEAVAMKSTPSKRTTVQQTHDDRATGGQNERNEGGFHSQCR